MEARPLLLVRIYQKKNPVGIKIRVVLDLCQINSNTVSYSRADLMSKGLLTLSTCTQAFGKSWVHPVLTRRSHFAPISCLHRRAFGILGCDCCFGQQYNRHLVDFYRLEDFRLNQRMHSGILCARYGHLQALELTFLNHTVLVEASRVVFMHAWLRG